ncbi:MAG: hypothetical protein LQ337_005500 [Flavoplaca oasis]|nr:MAG: hypothetical protein LQ337_005500 [Flavoplaca oasis]
MPSLRDSVSEASKGSSSGQVQSTQPTNTSNSYTRDNLHLAEAKAKSVDNVACLDPTEHRHGSLGPPPGIAMIQRTSDLYDLDNPFKDFSAHVDRIIDNQGRRPSSHGAGTIGPGSPRTLSSRTIAQNVSMDEKKLPDNISAQVAYLNDRINSLEAHFRPNSLFLTHIDGLVTHINRVTTYLNIISQNTDRRFAILTNAHTQHSGQIMARQHELEQGFDKRIDHQTNGLMDQLDNRAADLRSRIDATNEALDQLTTTFNQLHVNDLSKQVQTNSATLQEMSIQLEHIFESVHQELENIRANTHAAAVTMSARNLLQAPFTNPPEDPKPPKHSPVGAKERNDEIGFTIKGAAAKKASARSSILDSPVPSSTISSTPTPTPQFVLSSEPFKHRQHPPIEISSTPTPVAKTSPATASSKPQEPPSPPSPLVNDLNQETHALVMRNNIGLSKIMTSEESYWAPQNVARRAADIKAAASSTAVIKPSLTDEQRSRMFRERLAKVGVRSSSRKRVRDERVETVKEEEDTVCGSPDRGKDVKKDDAEMFGNLTQVEDTKQEEQVYGNLDQFEQLLEERSKAVSLAGTEGMLDPFF